MTVSRPDTCNAAAVAVKGVTPTRVTLHGSITSQTEALEALKSTLLTKDDQEMVI